MSRRQPTVFSMNPALVDVLDEVARGLGVPRSRVAEAYLEEALRSRCLWPTKEPGPAAEPTLPPIVERVSARATSTRRERRRKPEAL